MSTPKRIADIAPTGPAPQPLGAGAAPPIPASMRAGDWGLLLLLSLLWGFSYFFTAVALKGGLPPVTLVLLRTALAALVLLPLVAVLGLSMPRDWATWKLFAVQSVLNNVVPFSLMAWAQTHIPSGLAAVLNATTPLWTLLVARALAGERLSFNKIAGVLFGLVGVATLIGPELAVVNLPVLMGMGAFLLGTLFYGFSALWMRKLRHISPIVSAASQLCWSSVLLAPIAAVTDRFWELPMPTPGTIGAVVGVAVFSTALAYIVFFRISASAGPQNAMLVTLLIPVTATLLGVVFLGEALTVHQVVGAVVIAMGLLVTDGRLLAYLRRQT